MAWIYTRPDSERFWIGYRVNGKQVLRSTGTSDRKQAEQELAKIEMATTANRAGLLTAELIGQLTGRTNAQTEIMLATATGQWLVACEKTLSRPTHERYETVIKEFCQFVHASETGPRVREIQKQAVSDFLLAKADKTSRATAKLYLRILSAFFNHCKANDTISSTPLPTATALKLNGKADRIRRAFTETELQTIFKTCPNDFWRFMVLSGFYIGARMGDLIGLTWGNVDFEQNVVRFTTNKTGKALAVPLFSTLRAFLLGLKKDAGAVKDAEHIWPEQAAKYATEGARNFSCEFYDEVLRPAGLVPARTHHAKKNGAGNGSRTVNEVSFHCLRHSFVSYLKNRGVNDSTARELAGHSSDDISDLYTHVDAENMGKAVALLPAISSN